MGDFGGDKDEFITDEARKVIEESIQAVFSIKDNQPPSGLIFSRDKVNSWCSQIIDNCLRGLNRLEKPFKYVVTCIVQQHVDAGLQTAWCGYFDKTDGAIMVDIVLNDILCVVTVFGLGI
eukprot:TRINITY_DN1025_c0_g1_i9.p1 TRINITY_DN1025_c0_g1~~TRINITY_DN1025_c0_g1_i9.p1  ORF type:complete len:120 (+),score=11.73 TRINITY_DN1025_c0_g1_i9:119-478(+)